MVTIVISEQCDTCKHHWAKGFGWKPDYVFTCKAYPDGVPEAIYIDGFDHTNPFPGDNGIRFEPIERQENTDEE